MLVSEPPISALDEVRQLNRLFLGFLRERAAVAAENYGLPIPAQALLEQASSAQIDAAASFPRALFRLCLPAKAGGAVHDPAVSERDAGEQVLRLVLLNAARNFSRMSGYSARLLLRLTDDEVIRLRTAEVDEVVAMSRAAGVVRAAFDDLGWLWRELLTEDRPEYRRRLLLLGLQPDFSIQPVTGLA
jgi:hypothetical protein